MSAADVLAAAYALMADNADAQDTLAYQMGAKEEQTARRDFDKQIFGLTSKTTAPNEITPDEETTTDVIELADWVSRANRAYEGQ